MLDHPAQSGSILFIWECIAVLCMVYESLPKDDAEHHVEICFDELDWMKSCYFWFTWVFLMRQRMDNAHLDGAKLTVVGMASMVAKSLVSSLSHGLVVAEVSPQRRGGHVFF